MQLNNPDMVEQAMDTNVKEVEPLFWVLEDALHAGKTGFAKIILDSFLYLGKYRPELIKEGLQVSHRQRLQSISRELLNNVSIKQSETVTMRSAIDPQSIPFKLEEDLKKHLVANPDVLCDALQDKISITGVEVEVDDEYKCDVVAESDRKFYPIELKIAQGTHAVVSQCSKYCYYFYRKLRYDRFKIIQGIVIANGYDAWSVNEIRKQGHWIFNIIPGKDDSISLRRIT